MMTDPQNIAQRLVDAVLEFTASGEHISDPLAILIGELVAAISELDARTYHIQR